MYYPNDMRQSKKVDTATATSHVWSGDEIALDITGSSTVSYIHGDKLIISGYGWYLYNAHGDVTALIDASGNITRSYEYDAFGNQCNSTGTDRKKYAYTKPYKGSMAGLEKFWDKLASAKKKYKVKAWGHTHGAWSNGVYDDENFSGDDGDKGVSAYAKLKAFLVIPGGKIKKYNWKTKKVNHS